GPPGAVADCTACDSEPTLWPEGEVLPTGRFAEIERAHATHGFADRIIEQGSGINVGERELVDEVAAETTHEILDAGGGVRRLDRHIRLHDLAVRVADSREDNGGLGKDVAFANAGFRNQDVYLHPELLVRRRRHGQLDRVAVVEPHAAIVEAV